MSKVINKPKKSVTVRRLIKERKKPMPQAPRGSLAVTRTLVESAVYDTYGILSSEEVMNRLNTGEAWIKDYGTSLPEFPEIWTEICGKPVKVAVYAELIDRWDEEPEASDPE